jgi:hypothetical protein
MKMGLILAALRYIPSALICVLATFITWLFSPVLAALSFTTKDGNLPRWCYWLQTHDNPLDGLWVGDEGYWHRIRDYNDYTWLFKHSNEEIAASFWLKYFARVAWLIRNPAYGVANQLGVDVKGLIELQHIERDSFEWRVWQTPNGHYVFKLYLLKPWAFGRSLRMQIGWKAVGQEPRMMLATHVNPFRKQ